MEATFTVQLLVYDLSQGMARIMSSQILGPDHAIDIVPHTAILVYGKEYFFGSGSGISVEDPEFFRSTRGMYPVQTIDLGSTTVTKAQFDLWCLEQGKEGSYTGNSYDLFSRNCNHFSNDAALKGLRLEQGVPKDILNIPDRFLSSPFGQAMRPMLQNMQVRGESFLATPTGQGLVEATASNKHQIPQITSPKANASVSDPKSSSNSTQSRQKPDTPMLERYCRPLLSSDNRAAITCAEKLESEILQKAAACLSNSQDLSDELFKEASSSLQSYLAQDHQVTLGLMLLRLLVLKDSTGEFTSSCLEWTRLQLKRQSLTDPAKSMAWCCLSNSIATLQSTADNDIPMDVVEAALHDMNISSRLEVKQAASSYLYNIAVMAAKRKKQEIENEEISDAIVSVFCGSLESINDEKDDVTLLRRLLICGVIIRNYKEVAYLASDLGLPETLSGLQVSGDNEILTQELVAFVNHAVS
jgi:desumoylating isopeptidase 1